MRRFLAGVIALGFVLLCSIPPVHADTNVYWLNYTGPTPVPPSAWIPVSPNNPLPVSGTFSATLAGFAPNGQSATLAVTSSTGNVALPTNGGSVNVYNTGSTAFFTKLGTTSGVTVTATTGDQVPAGGCLSYAVGSNTFVAAITASSTSTLVVTGGSGLGTCGGGGGGAGSGGGAVFGPTAVGSAAANPPVLMGGTANATATGNVQVVKVDTNGTQFIDCSAAGNTLCTEINAGVGTPGSAPPTNVIYWGANASGATGGLIQGVKQCDQHKLYDASTNGATLLVTGVASRKIYICGFLFGTGSTATNVKLIEGTTTTTPCDTGASAVTPAFQIAANAQTGALSAVWTGLVTANAADNLCINTSAGNAVQADVWFTIQ